MASAKDEIIESQTDQLQLSLDTLTQRSERLEALQEELIAMQAALETAR